jgi:hypothetical protein
MIHCQIRFETSVSILSWVTWTTVKKMDGIQTKVSTECFYERQVLSVTFFETEAAI